MLHEMEDHDRSIYITLTYDDNHIPDFDSLRKEDLVKFFKRLRRKTDKKIRYFATGEYGDRTDRPHYHAIIFGLGFMDRQIIMDSWTKCDWTPIRILKSFGFAEPDSINYVAGYIQKKLSGELAEEEYTKKNREPVFRLLSMGLGKKYCDANAEQIQQQLFIAVRGVKMSIPRYYVNRLNLDTERIKRLNEIKDCEETEQRTGRYVTRDELYTKLYMTDDVIKNEEGIKNSRVQHTRNLQAKADLKKAKL